MHRLHFRARALLLLLALAPPASAQAQSALPDLSLEELMKLDSGQVFGASERLQPVTEAPASVSFVTGEEIARYGYRTLADVLRSVRGMYVTDDRNFSFIGTRGFGKPGDYNSRILLLVNGHRVNDNVFGQAEIGAEFGLDPAMIERVEIIRGPASSLYGDSAFFAVVNVITKTGGSLGGGSIALEAGTLGTQLTRALRGRQMLTAGAEFIDNVRQDQDSHYEDPLIVLLESNRSSTQHAVYAQDELQLSSWLILNGGLRYDAYEDFHRVSPRAALIAMPSPAQSIKYLFGEAFRAPNAYERIAFYFGERVNRLRPESIDTHELVWERYTNDWLRTSVSSYWYKADRLITLVPDEDAFLGVTYVNQDQVRARGLEFEAQMRLKWESQALVSYGLQKATDQATHAELPNSPRHIAKARISVPGPTDRSVVSIEARYLSSRGTLSGARVSPAASVNVTMVQPLGRSWELIGAVRNLFDAPYADPASGQHRQDTIPQNGRTARVGLRWNLWTK
ncbi:MAG: TonB-dependent receptor plug domain-containing protein [Vicinamibacterales bacterium]